MAIPGYMWVYDDQNQLIKGNSEVSGREHSIEILGFQHKIYIPNDRDTGSLTGTRKHEAFLVTKEFCSASPILNKACCNGETLKKLQVSWYRINDQGQEEEYFRHVLDNVKVVSVEPHMEDIKDKSKESYGHLESVAFRYERIQWTYLDGNIAAEDQWTQKG